MYDLDVKKLQSISTLSTSIVSVVCMLVPLSAWAVDAPAVSAVPSVSIVEIQPGSATSASEEFIELYNNTTSPIDLSAHAWQLEIASTTATSWDSPLRTIPLTGTLAPMHSYVVASQYSSNGQQVSYLSSQAQAWFSAGIAATAGHIRLTYATNQVQSDGTCSPTATVVDEVEWSTAKNGQAAIASLDARHPYLASSSSGIAKTTSLQRTVAASDYVDSNDDAVDFVAAAPSPNVLNVAAPTATVSAAESPGPLPVDACDPAPPTPGGGGSPGDDSDSGSDPTGGDDRDQTGDGGPDDGTGEQDINLGLQATQITEILPNPAPPQTDAADEFIELYNPNDTPFVLEGYKLRAGITTTHTYTFPAGTILPPHAFVAYFSADTGLSLSNTSGQVALLNPNGTVITQTGEYGAAKDGQAWVLTSSGWQWTFSPTPNAANVITAPAVKAATTTTKPKAATTTKKTTAKTAPTKATKPKTGAEQKAQLVAATKPALSPLHPGVLAAAAVFALLYGAYEYRHDVANKFRQLRDYRAARRAPRQGAAGRRDN